MMKAIRTTLLPLFALLLFAGCSASAPKVDYDPAALHRPLHTYAVEESPGSNIDPLNSQRIRRAIEGNLQAKGYRPGAHPDFVARYDVYVVEDVPSNFSFGFGIGSYGHHGGGSVGTSVTPTRDKVGIRIDMFDPESGKVFWTASVNKSMPEFTTPQSRTSFFNAVVHRLLEDFPEAKR